MATRGKKSAGKSKGKKGGGRKSRAESMTGKKENEVEVRTAGIGDNSELAMPEPTDWNHHKKTIIGYREKVTTAQGLLRNAIKTAKKSGIDMGAMDKCIAIERDNDPRRTMNYFQQIGLGLELSEISIRITAHDTLAGDETDLVAKRGYEDGKAGRTADNKYPPNSDLALVYAKNWRKGQGELMGLSEDQIAENEAALVEPEKMAAE